MTSTRKQAVLNSGVFKEIIPQLFSQVNKAGAEQVLVRCPFDHDDKNPSLSVNTAAGLFHCFACGAKGNGFDLYMKMKDCDFKTALRELEELAGITPPVSGKKVVSKVVATFVYHDAQGRPQYWKKRYEPGFDGKRRKSFAFYHGDLKKAEKKGRGGKALLYNLHHLVKLPEDEPVFFVEGEKCASVLTRWGLCATTLDAGGQAGKGAAWRQKWNTFFTGRDVYILPDNDLTGEEYAATLAKHLVPVAASVKALRLPGLPHKGDLVDWLKKEEVADE